MKSASPLNLEDIARLSGFSRSTVSRVINHQPYVHEETRQKILQTIQRYGFQPNEVARALVLQRSQTLGILIPHVVPDLFNDTFLAQLLQNLTMIAHKNDYNVNLWLESSYGSEINHYHKALRHRLLDGWIVASAAMDFVGRLSQGEIPYLLIGKPSLEHTDVNYVDVENKIGAYRIVEYLIQRGYRRIGMIQGRYGLLASQQRYEGYIEALKQAGLNINSHHITLHRDYSEMAGYHGMQQLLQMGIEAIFACNDIIAMGAMRAIKEAGLRIPDDIAICGFDDLPIARQLTPPLTTVRQPISDLASHAVEGLITILEGKHTGFYQRVLPVELVVREST